MPFTKIFSAAFFGIDAIPIEIEIDLTPSEKLTFVIVGLPDTAVKESKDRVLPALKNSGYQLNNFHCVANLAPGDLKKEGSLYDLPIALGLLQANNCLKTSQIEEYLVIGELALNGDLRAVSGILLSAILAKQLGKKGIIVPYMNASEASLVQGIEVIAVKNLKEAVFFLEKGIKPLISYPSIKNSVDHFVCIDFKDIIGQYLAKRALEIAAAGGHNLLMSGPPGSGKTMLAKAMLSIMPELNWEESIEVTKIHSVAGFNSENVFFTKTRPFRSPHHTISYAGLIGGGTYPRPGEVTLSHKGILFLDELPEFSRKTLEVLRQPLEDRSVTISRSQGNITFPTHFTLIAAMNPCPCGYLGHPDKPCKDSEKQVLQYRQKISGPLLDRIDLHVDVPQIKYKELLSNNETEHSKEIKNRVIDARNRQFARFGKTKLNSEMDAKELKQHVQLTSDAKHLLEQAAENMGISARGFTRILKVALTIADLQRESLQDHHILEALQYRGFNSLN